MYVSVVSCVVLLLCAVSMAAPREMEATEPETRSWAILIEAAKGIFQKVDLVSGIVEIAGQIVKIFTPRTGNVRMILSAFK